LGIKWKKKSFKESVNLAIVRVERFASVKYFTVKYAPSHQHLDNELQSKKAVCGVFNDH